MKTLLNIRARSRHLRRWLATLVALSMLASAAAQGLGGGAAGLSAADLAIIRGVTGGGMAGGLQLGGQNLGSMLTIATPMLNQGEEDHVGNAKEATEKTPPKEPLPPNEFQKYVLETTGQPLPLFGADFFQGLANHNLQLSRTPVADDYVVGPGDQLIVRVWGAASVEAPVTVDRRGEVAFPKFGNLSLAGVKAGQLDAVVHQYFSKFFKGIQVSVAVSRLRKITVYAVGQARQPGSYALSSQSTLTTALFASGGPSVAGSVRRVQLRRQGQTVAEFDLYAFLGRGDKSADIKLQDGDVLFYPKAMGYVALRGKVNQPAVYEMREANETVADMLNLAGGLPVVADPRRATLDRLQPGRDQPRTVQEFALNADGLRTRLQDGDVIHVAPIVAEMANVVTLRGAVAQPGRMAWRAGMRVSDVIPNKNALITPETVRLQSESLFDAQAQERTARQRARVPVDLAAERVLDGSATLASTANPQLGNTTNPGNVGSAATPPKPAPAAKSDAPASPAANDQAQKQAQQGKPVVVEETIVDRVGRMVEPVNFDYAVVERFDRAQLKVNLIPFNLGRMLSAAGGSDDPVLQPGDVITIFTAKDIRMPESRQQVFVRIEGEVNNPGVYPVLPGENLQTLLAKAGNITPDAYLYAIGLYREEVKRSQQKNLEKLLRRLEAETSGAVAQASQSFGGSADAMTMQARVNSIQQAQRQSLERFRSLQPEGRIALGLKASIDLKPDNLPPLRLQNGDRIQIPLRPDFVYVFGAVNTESALIYKPGLQIGDYLKSAGISVASDPNAVILVRADGSAMTNTSRWGNSVLSAQAMPGDTIVLPEKFNRESVWSQAVRSAKDFTQILYQLGLGAAAVKTLRQ